MAIREENRAVEEHEKEQKKALETELGVEKESSKQKKKHFLDRYRWIMWGVCISLIVSILFTCFYDSFRTQANANINNPLESINNMTYMYQNCYVLYRDLYNSQNADKLSFMDLYLQPTEGTDEELLKKVDYLTKYGYVVDEGYINGTEENATDAENLQIDIKEEVFYELREIMDYLENHFEEIENSFGQMNAVFDYVIEDTTTGTYLTNLSSPVIDLEHQFFYVSFLFDEYGNASVEGDVLGSDATKIRKNANEVIRNCSLINLVDGNGEYTDYQEYAQLTMPVNCKITFCITNVDWQQMMDNNYSVYYEYMDGYMPYFSQYEAYNMTDCGEIYMVLLLLVGVMGFLFPRRFLGESWKENMLCRPAFEILIIGGLIVIAFGSCVVELVMWVCCGDAISSLATTMSGDAATVIVYWLNILALTALFCGAWYVGVCARAIRELGFKEYMKQRCAFYQIFPFIKRKLMDVYNEAVHFDVTQNANKLILNIVIINAVILFVIGSLWVGGFTIAVIYSVILYFILRKYISGLQKKYSILLKATNEIAQGNLNVTITEDLGVFEPFKPQVIRIQEGFKRAVEEEVKSQRMKSELITNVSHDLKTPLTAIITYINLLQEENITEEQRKEYLNTLERKSLRLKVLIEDLFEVSKATSQTVTLNIMDVDIVNLIKQVQLEMSDKLNAAQLDVRLSLPEEKYILPLDSQKTYRIFENLFGNIAKYALPGTRVYVTGRILETTSMDKNGDGIEITLKNITAEELNVTPEELTERFVRGDASRNTEGSGLGLAIAKSFTELQGGKFVIQMDGDLFKVTTIWKKPE